MADPIEPAGANNCGSNRPESASLAVRKAGSAGHARKADGDCADRCLLRGAYPCLPQGPSATPSRVFVRSDVTKPSGFLLNTALYPRLQKWWVSPACSEEAVAPLGSSGIPQTSSSCAAVDRVAILKLLLFLLSTLHECGQSKAERACRAGTSPKSCLIRKATCYRYRRRGLGIIRDSGLLRSNLAESIVRKI